MKRMYAMSLCAILALGACTSAMADEKDAIIKQLNERLDKMQKEINELKNVASNIKKDTEEQIDELHTRADENELQSTLNKVKLGFDFENSVNFLDGDYMGQKIDAKDKWTSVFHLNMAANVNENTNFYGRIGVSRNWSDYTLDYSEDYSQGRNAKGGTLLFLERAYFDYKINDKLIVTIGRQPGSDGPGFNLKNNSVRMATYPALLFSANGDGIIFTYKPDIPTLENSAFRAGYAKMYQWDDGKHSSFFGNEEIDDARIALGMFETKLPLGSMGDNLLILMGVHSKKVSFHNDKLGDLNIGDLTMANLYFENNKAFGSKLNYFVSLGYVNGSNAVNNENLINQRLSSSLDEAVQNAYQVGLIASGGNEEAAAAAAAAANKAGTVQLAQQSKQLAQLTRLNEEDAWAIHLGARYDFNDQFKLGYQYFHGSQYWYSFQSPSVTDPLQLTQTRGDVHDVYVIYQIDFNQFLRLGYSHVNYKYTNSGRPFGGAQKIDDTVRNIMLTYNLKF